MNPGDIGCTTWNGPICSTCSKRYLGAHTCSREDVVRRIIELARLLDAPSAEGSGTTGCPCRPENGGSGVCGCILNGLQITCST